MPWFLYHAFKQLFPTGKRFPFFTLMSGLLIALGVALMLVAASIMGGFGYEIRRMIVETQGEIQIVAIDGNIENPDSLVAEVTALPQVIAATPTANSKVGLLYRGRAEYPDILGVDLQSVQAVFDLPNYLRAGSLEDLDDDSVIVSAGLARGMGISLGDNVEVASPLLLRAYAGEIILPTSLRVVGIFEIGHQQLDRNLIICTLRRMGDLLGADSPTSVLNVRLTSGADEFAVARELDRRLPNGYRALTWFETNADFQSIIRFEKYMFIFTLGFIVLVAALAMMSSLLITVVRKTREIGLLGSLGAQARHVAASFCIQGIVLGICGTAAGLIFGFVVLAFRNEIVGVLAPLTVGREVFLEFYQFVNLPRHTETKDVLMIVVFAIVLSALAGLFPAWRAARLKPAEALRSE